jgi:hypothetical protein
MTIQKAIELLNSSNPTKANLQKAIDTLNWQIEYVQKIVTAGLRESSSAEIPVKEMRETIQQLKEKMESINQCLE